MELFRVSHDLYGQEVLEGVSWDLLPVAVGIGAVVIIGYAGYRMTRGIRGTTAVVSASPPGSVSRIAAADRIERHKGVDRIFHWVTAVAVLTLVATGFLPVVGVKFDWVTIHWIAGVVLLALVLFHLVRSLLWQRLRELWISADDLAGKAAGKYSLAQKLMHHAMTLMVLGVACTGIAMLAKVNTPLWKRNPYLLSPETWGTIYVVHGLAALCAVTLVMIHVYFGVLPENRMYLRAMIRGWMGRQEWLARGHTVVASGEQTTQR